MVDETFPPATCPWCTSLNTVRTGMLVTHAFLFCLACGKGFERRDRGYARASRSTCAASSGDVGLR